MLEPVIKKTDTFSDVTFVCSSWYICLREFKSLIFDIHEKPFGHFYTQVDVVDVDRMNRDPIANHRADE